MRRIAITFISVFYTCCLFSKSFFHEFSQKKTEAFFCSAAFSKYRVPSFDYEEMPPCDLNIAVSAQNCTGSNSFTAEWQMIVTYSDPPAGDIIYQRNSETSSILTPNTSPDTITISGVPADGGKYDTLRVYFAGETTCGDTAVLTRPVPCPSIITSTGSCSGNAVSVVDFFNVVSEEKYLGTPDFDGAIMPASTPSGYGVLDLGNLLHAGENLTMTWAGIAVGLEATVEVSEDNISYTTVPGGPFINTSTDVNAPDNQVLTLPVNTRYVRITNNNPPSNTIYIDGFSYTNVNCQNEVPAGENCSTLTSTEIGGSVFEDWNYDGIMNQSDTTGVPGVAVYLYDCNGNIADTVYTDTNGNYKFTGLGTGALPGKIKEEYRIEFVLPETISCWALPTKAGADNGTTVQFIQPGNCANLGIASPADYCDTDPLIILPCYVNGRPPLTTNDDVLVGFAYSSSDYDPIPGSGHLAQAAEIGSTWGMAFKRSNKTLFAAAILKRHSGLVDNNGDGTGDLGAIYQKDMMNPAAPPTLWLDVASLGIDIGLGLMPSIVQRNLPTDKSQPSYDSLAYDMVGKIGIGDLDISEDGNTLYFINLFEKNLYAIDIASQTIVSGFPVTLPNPCSGTAGESRPFGLGIYKGEIFAGTICDAQSSQDAGALSGAVYKFSGGTFEQVLYIPLTYTRGHTDVSCATESDWKPWIPAGSFPTICDGAAGVVYPQPMVSDIAFDVDGSMIIGLMDRAGHQIGYLNYGLTGGAIYESIVGGDILRAGYSGGIYQLESNGTAGTATSGGAGNGQGPGNGEFYFEDLANFFGGAFHQETFTGGLGLLPGLGELTVTAIDPMDEISTGDPGQGLNSGGLYWFGNKGTNAGRVVREYQIYDADDYGPIPAVLSKANGLGDLEFTCAAAPLEIGNYVWEDINGDGIQDACEPGIAGVRVELYDMSGTLIAFDTTDAGGEYYFSHSDSTDQNWIAASDSVEANTMYYILVGQGQFAANQLTLGGIQYTLTVDSTGSATSPNATDSDAEIGSGLPGSLDGFPLTKITTGNSGAVDHSFDFGFVPPCNLDITVTAQNCIGTGPFTSEWQIILTYSENIPSGDISYQRNSDAILSFTPNTSPDTVTISGIPADGGKYDTIRVYFAGDTACGDTAVLIRPAPCPSPLGSQSGEICSTVSSTDIAGTVFEDWNYDGIMNQSDTAGVAGVSVYLYDCDGNIVDTAYTDSNGNYLFTGLGSGALSGKSIEEYRVEFVLPETISCWAALTQAGSDNGTGIQFVRPGSCANLGIASPADYCQDTVSMSIPCYVNGDALGGGTAGPSDAWVAFSSTDIGNYTGTNPILGDASQVGAIWGQAYQRKNGWVFGSAVVRRHVGLGSIDGTNTTTGGIYYVDKNSGAPYTPVRWLNVNTLPGVNTGQDPRTEEGITLPADRDQASHDSLSFSEVGKRGIGDIDMYDDDSTLLAINLYEKTLLKIDVASRTLSETPILIPDPGCSDGEYYPWGIGVDKGRIFVGVVCGALTSQSAGDLHAYVYELTGSSFRIVLDFPLDYSRGLIWDALTNVDDWIPWQDDWSGVDHSFATAGPSPILADIDFANDGSMMLSFIDRAGMQIGYYNYSTNSADFNLYEGFAGGDLLKACKSNDTWILEGSGSCFSTLPGSMNNQGPNGYEFYYQDSTAIHQELSFGGIIVNKGNDDVLASSYAPTNNERSGGIRYYDNTTGQYLHGYEIYPDPGDGNTGNGVFGKAVGLGDIAAFCNPAPIEIGNYVWEDTNGDGIQDACEPGIAGVRVELFDMSGTLIAFDTTDAGGEYYFSHSDSTDQNWIAASDSVEANTMYYILVGQGQFSANQLTLGGIQYTLTVDSTGSATSPNATDSDAEIGSGLPGSLDGFPITKITTGNSGAVDHSFDFGFVPPCYLDIAVTTQNCTGTGPFTSEWQIILTYSGQKPSGDISYQRNSDAAISFTPNTSPDTVTISGVSADGEGSDTIRVFFANETTCGDSIIVKRPVPCPPDIATCTNSSGCIGGNAYEDLNCDGTNELSELGVQGVRVIIYDCDNNPVDSTLTDSDGDWQICGLTDAVDYRVEFLLSQTLDCIYSPSHVGSDNESHVQFVQANNCIDFGLVDYQQDFIPPGQFDLDFELAFGTLPALDSDLTGNGTNESVYMPDVGGRGQSPVLPPFGIWGGAGGYLVTGLDASSGSNFIYFEGIDNCLNLGGQYTLEADKTYEVCFDVAALDPDDASNTNFTKYFTVELNNSNSGRFAIIGHPLNEPLIDGIYATGTNTAADYASGSGSYFIPNTNLSVSTVSNDPNNIEWKRVCVTYTSIDEYESLFISSFGESSPAGGIALDNISVKIKYPLEIGNYVWCDSIENGIQDACEKGIDSLIVRLYDANNVLVGQDTSIAGSYLFNENNVDTAGITVDINGAATPNTGWSGLDYNSDYHIVFGYGQYDHSTNEFTIGSNTYQGFTTANAGNNDNIDSDVAAANYLIAVGSKPGLHPAIDMTTDSAGCGDHKYDLGLICGSCEFDLALKKELLNTDPVHPGGKATFKIKVYNQGDCDASEVVIHDYIPSGFTLLDSNWDNTANASTAIDTISILTAGDSATLIIALQADLTANGNYVNNAEIVSATGGTDSDSPLSNLNDGSSNELATDNDIDDNSSSAPGSTDNPADEDDYDPAQISISCLPAICLPPPAVEVIQN